MQGGYATQRAISASSAIRCASGGAGRPEFRSEMGARSSDLGESRHDHGAGLVLHWCCTAAVLVIYPRSPLLVLHPYCTSARVPVQYQRSTNVVPMSYLRSTCVATMQSSRLQPNTDGRRESRGGGAAAADMLHARSPLMGMDSKPQPFRPVFPHIVVHTVGY